MKDEIVISRYKEEDLQGVLDMIQQAFSTRALGIVYEDDVMNFWLSEYTEEEIIKCAKTKHLYVAKLNDRIVGSGAVSEDDGKAYISAVFVDPNVQGQGLGKKIIETLEQDELCQKLKKIYLTAVLSAGRFYQKMGYSYKYEIPEIIVDGCLDVVYMEKDLN